MAMSKVSIIIPVFNHAQYLSQAIESALEQDYGNTEIIVVNDGSTDNSLAVARSYEGKGVRVISQKNRGLSLTRNAGIAASSGKFILPLDSDDWIDRDYLSKTVPQMSDEVGIVGTFAACFGIKDYTWHTSSPTLDQLKMDNCIPVCSLIRRSVLMEVGGYNPALSGYDKEHIGYEDWNLWIDIVKRGWKVVIVPEAIFHYREKHDSMLKRVNRPKLIAKIKSLHPDLWPSLNALPTTLTPAINPTLADPVLPNRMAPRPLRRTAPPSLPSIPEVFDAPPNWRELQQQAASAAVNHPQVQRAVERRRRIVEAAKKKNLFGLR
jgi:glycosyltransferase involved in cell wall biosynthesis